MPAPRTGIVCRPVVTRGFGFSFLVLLSAGAVLRDVATPEEESCQERQLDHNPSLSLSPSPSPSLSLSPSRGQEVN